MEVAETVPRLTIEPMRLANWHHQAGGAAEAADICQQVVARVPHQPDALHLPGIIEAQAGRLDAAVGLLRRSVAERPDFPLAWSHLGCVLVHAARREEALAAYDHVVQLAPADALGHHARGILLRDLGRTEEALAAFTRATELQPDFADSHFKLGLTLRKLGRADGAIRAYSRAIELTPDFPDAYNNLGNAQRDKGRLDAAIAAYRHAIRLKPTDAVSLCDRPSQDDWDKFLKFYGPTIYHYGRRHGLQDADALDVVQNVCMRVYRAVQTLQYDARRGTLEGWLYTIAVREIHRCRTRTSIASRRLASHNRTGTLDDVEMPEHGPSDNLACSDLYEYAEPHNTRCRN